MIVKDNRYIKKKKKIAEEQNECSQVFKQRNTIVFFADSENAIYPTANWSIRRTWKCVKMEKNSGRGDK